MRRDLEQKYAEMQAGPKKVFFSPLPADADIHAVAVDVGDDDDEDDFVLDTQPFLGGLGLDAIPESADGPAKAEKKADGQPAAPSAEAKGDSKTPAEPAVAHSIATGGDALLDIAMKEEAESHRKKKKTRKMTGGAKTATGFIIFCPYGCKIEVKETHRGMSGKCPKCRAPFLVPIDPPDYVTKEKPGDAAAAAAAAAAPGGFVTWLNDLHVHTVSPEKLKLKADSLLKEFTEKDFGFSPEKMVVVALGKKAGGLFGGGDKKKGDPRETMLAHLREGKPLEELPVAEKQVYSADEVRQMRVVQPVTNRMESMFHGIAVFGEKKIAVQLPLPAQGDPQFVSFGLTQFRQFAKALAANYGMERFGADLGIPFTDETTPMKCAYNDTQIKALKNVEWYQADPACKVVLAGYKCESCHIFISEEARKKEKLGGANGKGLAKAMCPKCKKKFGEHPVYVLQEDATAPSMSEPGGSTGTTPVAAASVAADKAAPPAASAPAPETAAAK
jgi:hypothetical protein